MGECGCMSNYDRYIFPAPGKAFYLLTLAGACPNCDSPSGVSIERIDPSNTLYQEYKRGEFVRGHLVFEKWPDSHGVGIVTGMRKDEFVKELLKHLVGVSSDDMGDDGVIDEIGAEVILEEMYEDSTTQPRLAKDEQ